MDINLIVTVLGLIAGAIFVCVNVRASKSLVGSFFKKYYRYLTTASIFFVFGWLSEFLEVFGFASAETAEFLHHVSLLIAGIIFVASSYYLPKEASEYMKSRENK